MIAILVLFELSLLLDGARTYALEPTTLGAVVLGVLVVIFAASLFLAGWAWRHRR